jgi:hypothetical protein
MPPTVASPIPAEIHFPIDPALCAEAMLDLANVWAKLERANDKHAAKEVECLGRRLFTDFMFSNKMAEAVQQGC